MAELTERASMGVELNGIVVYDCCVDERGAMKMILQISERIVALSLSLSQPMCNPRRRISREAHNALLWLFCFTLSCETIM